MIRRFRAAWRVYLAHPWAVIGDALIIVMMVALVVGALYF